MAKPFIVGRQLRRRRHVGQVAQMHRLDFDCSAIEDFDLGARIPFDVAFALRVGALDGRHPDLYDAAVGAVARALRPGGVLLVDGGDPLRRIELPAS